MKSVHRNVERCGLMINNGPTNIQGSDINQLVQTEHLNLNLKGCDNMRLDVQGNANISQSTINNLTIVQSAREGTVVCLDLLFAAFIS